MKHLIGDLHRRIFLGKLYAGETVPDVNSWKLFLDSLPHPQNCVEMAHNKFLCKLKYLSRRNQFVMNCISFFALIPAMILACLPAKKMQSPVKGRHLFEQVEKLDYRDVAPKSLFERYSDTIFIERVNVRYGRLSNDAKRLFFRCVKSYPGQFFFQLLAYKDMAKYSMLFAKYNPEAITVFVNERNIASPLVTELHEKSGRKFISFMHGDYLLQLIQAYLKFSEYYIWNEEYREMFVQDLRCDPDQFKVYTPGKLTKKWHLEDVEPEYYCTYYLSGGESREALVRVAEVYKKLKKAGKKCKLRPHPRFHDYLPMVREVFDGFYIEDPLKVSMEESIGQTEHVIGIATTVLNEAIVEGRKVVLDDVSDPVRFNNLADRKYNVLQQEHSLLSEFI